MGADHPRGGVLLLSGGLDSTALAALIRPDVALYVDYGQRPAKAERSASRAVAQALGIRFRELRLDLAPLGRGLLVDDIETLEAPSPEWWPYRNQFLVTAAAAVALQESLRMVSTGSVRGDGDRHVDGTAAFYDALDTILAMQEGNVRVQAPALSLSTAELIRAAGVSDSLLGWTVSCHRGDLPCHACPGCWKRAEVLRELDILQR